MALYNDPDAGTSFLGEGYQPLASEQLAHALQSGVIGAATAADIYGRLIAISPSRELAAYFNYRKERSIERYYRLFARYAAQTGRQPLYQINHTELHDCEEGWRKALAIEAACDEAYRALGMRNEGADAVYIQDYGQTPFVVNIDAAATQNDTYRTALWTGNQLQVTLMSIGVHDDIGLEVHPTTDQFLRIEHGRGLVQMGDSPDHLDFEAEVFDDYAIMIPAGKWHNLTNTGDTPIKLYAIYAPPEHPFGTVHPTKADAMAAESS
jgi:mannose-6-phosphate isomerase-like protein (cupin superfamily)